ncbi:hypothetical protein D1631_17080 [Chryseobacterium nematophagum]|uniref:Uncharacterized protein n=1 Tax=Chryseobacterium nematophagum TaxID=2305228 RepID=A0A3M7TLQ4_9FLAO|nr:hypothetical protein [Chryseobacterium nematophagum]RNA63509.1 hypothetical protein D1631_17080 [Chryseobacterium nematophagum]
MYNKMYNRFINFLIPNEKAYSSDIEKIIWRKTEKAIENKIQPRLRQVKDELEELNLLVEIDMKNRQARLVAEGIPRDKIEIVKNAIHKMKD